METPLPTREDLRTVRHLAIRRAANEVRMHSFGPESNEVERAQTFVGIAVLAGADGEDLAMALGVDSEWVRESVTAVRREAALPF